MLAWKGRSIFHNPLSRAKSEIIRNSILYQYMMITYLMLKGTLRCSSTRDFLSRRKQHNRPKAVFNKIFKTVSAALQSWEAVRIVAEVTKNGHVEVSKLCHGACRKKRLWYYLKIFQRKCTWVATMNYSGLCEPWLTWELGERGN